MSDRQEKFTPGPWRVVANFSNAYVCYGEPEIYDENTVPPNQCVCGCGRKSWNCGDGDNLHNAYLIAAAPEMYSCLAGICMEKSAHICEYAPESCGVCEIHRVLKKSDVGNTRKTEIEVKA